MQFVDFIRIIGSGYRHHWCLFGSWQREVGDSRRNPRRTSIRLGGMTTGEEEGGVREKGGVRGRESPLY